MVLFLLSTERWYYIALFYLCSFSWCYFFTMYHLQFCDMICSIPYDRLNKLYSHYMAATVGIVSSYMHGLTIKAHCRNQPNKSKLALYKLLLSQSLKIAIHSNKMQHSSYKGSVTYVGVHVSKHLKESWLGLQINGFRLLVI